MDYAIPHEILKMQAKDRWKRVHRCLAQWRTVDAYRVWLAQSMYSLGFECVWFVIDQFGMRFGIWGERYLYVKRRKTDSYGYIVSRFGVTRVRDLDND